MYTTLTRNGEVLRSYSLAENMHSALLKESTSLSNEEIWELLKKSRKQPEIALPVSFQDGDDAEIKSHYQYGDIVRVYDEIFAFFQVPYDDQYVTVRLIGSTDKRNYLHSVVHFVAHCDSPVYDGFLKAEGWILSDEKFDRMP